MTTETAQELPYVCNVEEVAQFARCSEKIVRREYQNGNLICREISRSKLFLRDDVLNWVNSWPKLSDN